MIAQDTPSKVTKIPVSDISPNPHNPRRLFDDEPMNVLRESIENLGVLVPVTVYQPAKITPGTKDYVLLDGERRWRCTQEIGDSEIPAIIIAEPGDTQNILTMFHIHNVRESWQLMPTALKLQALMKDLQESREAKLKHLTKLTISQIRRCKILLTYPKRFQEMMLAPASERMKVDFFIELDRIRRPARNDPWIPWKERGDRKCIEILLDKYQSGVIVAVTDFRQIAAIYGASKENNLLSRFMKEFGRFLDDPERGIDDINVPGASFAAEAMKIRKSATTLINQLVDLDLESIASDEIAIQKLSELHKMIGEKLQNALLIGVRDE